MLSLRDALESALVENPDDLATHYAYADYLQEQGDPRGEFIQLQLALEDPQRSEAEKPRFEDRAKELLKEHEREWLGDLADHLLPPRENLRRARPRPNQLTEHHFARGWLDFLVLHDPNGPTYYDPLASWEDSVQETRRYREREVLRGYQLAQLLCSAPEARLLRKLSLEYDIGLVDALLDSPFLHNLRLFQLGRSISEWIEQSELVDSPCEVDSPSIPDLVAKLPRIEELRLLASGYVPARLFSLSNLSSLRILQVYYLKDRYPLEVLADNPALKSLTHLLLHPFNFSEPCIDVAGVRAIVQSTRLRNLRHLQLHCSDLGDVGCTEIVTSGILKRLKVLDLRNGEITDTGARILADCPDLRRLELLDIERNALTQSGIDALRRVLGPALRGDNQQNEEELAQRQYLYEEDLA